MVLFLYLYFLIFFISRASFLSFLPRVFQPKVGSDVEKTLKEKIEKTKENEEKDRGKRRN
jgi:hypothetical protein